MSAPDDAGAAARELPAADVDGAGCADVGARAREVIRRAAAPELEPQLAAMSEVERATAEAQIEERLATIAVDVEHRCTLEGWPPAVRTCLIQVSAPDDAQRCLGGAP
jgi:hypothetical protein